MAGYESMTCLDPNVRLLSSRGSDGDLGLFFWGGEDILLYLSTTYTSHAGGIWAKCVCMHGYLRQEPCVQLNSMTWELNLTEGVSVPVPVALW